MEALSRTQRDDLVHAIDQTLTLYRKKLEPAHVPFWLDAVQGCAVDDVKQALKQHVRTDRREPRPADIVAILGETGARKRSALPAEPQRYVKPPAHVEQAWRWFIAYHAGDVFGDQPSVLSVGAKAARDTPAEVADEYLLIVNREAKRLKMPEAIPDRYRLAEVWG